MGCASSLGPDKVCASQDKQHTRQAWQSSTSKASSKLSASQPPPQAVRSARVEERRPSSQPSAASASSKRDAAPKTKVRPCSNFFWRFPEMTPFPTLPGRKLARPRGGRLRSVLRDVEVARPSQSRRPQTIRFAPPLFQTSRKIRWFLARPSRAHACCAVPEWSKHLFPDNSLLKCQARFRGLPGGPCL